MDAQGTSLGEKVPSMPLIDRLSQALPGKEYRPKDKDYPQHHWPSRDTQSKVGFKNGIMSRGARPMKKVARKKIG